MKHTGFALIEVLMAVTLVAVISLAVYGSFSSGLRVMDRIAHPVLEEDLSVFFEKLTRELENAFHYADIPFAGESKQLVFATAIRSDPAVGGERAVGRVTYFFDRKKIGRSQEDLNQIYEEKEGKPVPVFEHVQELRFEYYGYEPSQSAYLWTDEWDPTLKKEKIPLAVRVEFEFDDGKTRQNLTRTIAIPAGE